MYHSAGCCSDEPAWKPFCHPDYAEPLFMMYTRRSSTPGHVAYMKNIHVCSFHLPRLNVALTESGSANYANRQELSV